MEDSLKFIPTTIAAGKTVRGAGSERDSRGSWSKKWGRGVMKEGRLGLDAAMGERQGTEVAGVQAASGVRS